MSTLYLLHKPYRMLSQFTDGRHAGEAQRATLADVIDVPGIYAAGRLDYDSEGLLLLTDDGALIHRISDPATSNPRPIACRWKAAPTSRHWRHCVKVSRSATA